MPVLFMVSVFCGLVLGEVLMPRQLFRRAHDSVRLDIGAIAADAGAPARGCREVERLSSLGDLTQAVSKLAVGV